MASRSLEAGSCGAAASALRNAAAAQGVTLAHVIAQHEDLRDTSLTLELNFSTFTG